MQKKKCGFQTFRASKMLKGMLPDLGKCCSLIFMLHAGRQDLYKRINALNAGL